MKTNCYNDSEPIDPTYSLIVWRSLAAFHSIGFINPVSIFPFDSMLFFPPSYLLLLLLLFSLTSINDTKWLGKIFDDRRQFVISFFCVFTVCLNRSANNVGRTQREVNWMKHKMKKKKTHWNWRENNPIDLYTFIHKHAFIRR